MEKRSSHCALTLVKMLVQAGRLRATFSALAGGAALGLDFEGMAAVVLALQTNDFYKSMTTMQTIGYCRTCIDLSLLLVRCI